MLIIYSFVAINQTKHFHLTRQGFLIINWYYHFPCAFRIPAGNTTSAMVKGKAYSADQQAIETTISEAERNMPTTTDRQRLFTEKARAVSATVQVTATRKEALEYAFALCRKRNKDVDPTIGSPTLAAPALSDEDFAFLEVLCKNDEVKLIRNNLRNTLDGIDVGCTYADFGIAETGTLVIHSTGEDLRLATMISDIHIAILPVSCIKKDATALLADLALLMENPANFTAFITGPSRTADIERVLAIGVHGPLELHILLIEDQQ